MPTTTLNFRTTNSQVASDNGNPALLFNNEELFEEFLYGIPRCTSSGMALSDNSVRNAIVQAQDAISKWLHIKLFPEIVTESQSYLLRNYAYITMRTDFPIHTMFDITGWAGKVRVINFIPDAWTTVRRTTGSDAKPRTFSLVPYNFGGVQGIGLVFFWYGFGVSNFIPDFWQYDYLTGETPIAESIRSVIGKIAAMNMLSLIGVTIGGIGVSTESISFDGLSQAISKIPEKYGVFGQRINFIKDSFKDLPMTLRELRGYYGYVPYISV